MGQFIVLDLEWNQSPAGKEGSMNRLPFEIIEIGAVKLNKNLQIISEFRRLIRPRVYRQMHYKISEVTHMSIEQLDTEGEDFVRVMTEFLEWCGDDYRFCTWGSMDLTELQRNMVYHGMELQFPSPLLYYDLQKIYALIHGTKQKESLDTVVEELHLTEDRPFHRALDDAYYTGRVMSEMDFYSMMEYVSVDYYQPPLTEEEEIYLEFPEYAKFVSREHETKEEILEERRVAEMVCYKCRRTLRKKIRWFSSNQKFYFCLAVCPEHGYMKGKIRMKKSEDGSFFAVKTTKLVGEEGAALGAGRDVVEHQLVRAGRVVHPGYLHRVGHVLDALEVRALDDPPAADVQTGNDAFCDHGLAPCFCTSATQRLRSSAPVYRLLPRMAAAVPISSSSSSSCSEEMPPLAVMATPGTSLAS